MQSVSFRHVEEFLDYLPKNELAIVEEVRKLLFRCVPDLTEKLSYNVPFYRKHKGLFFIWPASVLWGKKKTYEGVRVGFNHGHLLNNDDSFLNLGERKFVAYVDIQELKDINVDRLREAIMESVLIDEVNKNIRHGIR